MEGRAVRHGGRHCHAAQHGLPTLKGRTAKLERMGWQAWRDGLSRETRWASILGRSRFDPWKGDLSRYEEPHFKVCIPACPGSKGCRRDCEVSPSTFGRRLFHAVTTTPSAFEASPVSL